MFKTTLLAFLIPVLAFAGTVTNRGDQTQIGNFQVRGAAGSQSASAIFEVGGTTTKGSIPAPKMTGAQCAAISSPTEGLLCFNTTTHTLNYYDGSVWQEYATTSNLVPTGSVLAWTTGTAPTGYLLADGTAVSRATYSALFALIGITHGQGDGSTTFNVPNYKGRFLRMRDNGAGVDPDAASRTAMATGGNTGDNVGSIQADTYTAHTHNQLAGTGSNHVQQGAAGALAGRDWFGLAGDLTSKAAQATSSSGGNETRPKNAYVNYIIKY